MKGEMKTLYKIVKKINNLEIKPISLDLQKRITCFIVSKLFFIFC